MKDSITKFDLEAAFKALDEIDVPVIRGGVRANKAPLNEIFSKKTKLDALLEEYYDVGNPEELATAKEDIEAEVAKAKLARIEKIVDLDADSPEDLLTSYVGKYIMQCPQCMTLFYKSKEDIVESEDDPTTVNVNEVCQHCGHEAGYTLIGKVGAADEEPAQEDSLELGTEEAEATDLTTDEGDAAEGDAAEGADIPEESEADFDLGSDLEELDLDIEEDEEKAEESFTTYTGDYLTEHLYDNESLCEEATFTDEEIKDFDKVFSMTFAEHLSSRGGTQALFEHAAYLLLTACEVAAAHAHDPASYIKNFVAPLGQPDLPDTAIDIYLELVGEIIYRMNLTIPKIRYITRGHKELKEFSDAYHAYANEASRVFNNQSYYRAQYWLYVNIAKYFKPLFEASETIKRLQEKQPDSSLPEALTEGGELTISQGQFEKLLNTELKKPVDDRATQAMLAELSAAGVHEDLEEANALTEGGLGALGKAIGKIKDSAMSREKKANWLLQQALIDYNKVKVDKQGECIPDESNRRFGTFLIIGYTNRYTNGRTITMPPTFTNKDLVVGMDRPEEKTSYKDADNIAKGWSKQQGNGPAFILMAKDKTDKKPVFLCEYFDGELDKEQDQLENYFQTVKKSLEGAKLRAKAGDTSSDTSVPASKIEPGMTLVIDGSKDPIVTGEVIKAEKSALSAGAIDITVKLENGEEKVFSGVAPTTILTVVRPQNKTESLHTFMSTVEELNESCLEQLITKSLTETYQNVKSFKLNSCSYLNEALTVDGTILFASGNTRQTAYVFTEATVANNTITMHGINEKLGLDKQFTMTGHADTNRTFIAESFRYLKK